MPDQIYPLGRKIEMPGHFAAPVVLESVRALGDGFECRVPKDADSLPAATAYQEIVTQMRRAYAQSGAERTQAEEDGLALRDRVRAAYPFHPALIDLMRERWAAIPDFQRTRGALRFLAACLRASHREGKSRAVLGPGDVPIHDSEVALACLKELKEQCLYLHFDGARYGFKKDPNVTLLIEQEAEAVGRNDKQVRARVKEMIEARLAGHRSAIVWPEEPAAIPDNDPSFLVAYLPLELGGKPRGQQEAVAKDLFEKSNKPKRSFRNGLGVAIPAGDQVEILRRAVRYLIAAEGVK